MIEEQCCNSPSPYVKKTFDIVWNHIFPLLHCPKLAKSAITSKGYLIISSDKVMQ